MTEQDKKYFWQAHKEFKQAQSDFNYADQDHIEVAIYRLVAAEKNLGIAHRICKMAEN